MLVNLSSLTVLPQQPPQNSHPPQPLNLGWHTSLSGTLSLTGTGVTTLSLGGEEVTGTSTRVDDGWLDDDVTVFEELSNTSSGVGVGDLGGLLWVEPDCGRGGVDGWVVSTMCMKRVVYAIIFFLSLSLPIL